MRVGSSAYFPLSESSSVVSRLSDSMALWYRNMGGMVFDSDATSRDTARSWIQCAPISVRDPDRLRDLLMNEGESPVESGAGCEIPEIEGARAARKSFLNVSG